MGEQEAPVTAALETPHGDGMHNAAEVIWGNNRRLDSTEVYSPHKSGWNYLKFDWVVDLPWASMKMTVPLSGANFQNIVKIVCKKWNSKCAGFELKVMYSIFLKNIWKHFQKIDLHFRKFWSSPLTLLVTCMLCRREHLRKYVVLGYFYDANRSMHVSSSYIEIHSFQTVYFKKLKHDFIIVGCWNIH